MNPKRIHLHPSRYFNVYEGKQDLPLSIRQAWQSRAAADAHASTRRLYIIRCTLKPARSAR